MPGPSPRHIAELERVVDTLKAADRARSSSGFIPHKPHPKQAEFLALDCLEALYGGAAGGGKSDALLMGALAYVHVPGYTAGLFRRTFADLALPGAIMDRAKAWLAGTGARWNEQQKRFTFRQAYGEPAVLQFGYLDAPKDRFRYQGTAFQYVGFDELTQFAEQSYRYLFSRLRKLVGVDVPLRVRAATNPGGIGHEWVRRRFIDPGDPSRPFVPALLVDNPSIDASSYRASLANLDMTTRRQLEEGLWVRDAGGLVYHFDEGRNVIAAAAVPSLAHKILAMDYGVAAPTSFTILGWADHDPTVYITRSWKKADMSPSEAAETAKALEQVHGFEVIVGDVGGLGKGFQIEARRREHLPIDAADKNNKHGYIAFFNGALERGRIKIVRDACEPLVTEWMELPWNEQRTKEATGFDNHCADGALYGWRRCSAFLEERDGRPPTPQEAIAEHERMLEEAADEEMRRELDGEWWEKGL